MKFPTVQELAKDEGLIGRALSRLPKWLREIADKRKDPWTFLLGVRGLPPGYQRVFRAAASQRKAALRLVERARLGGSISTSWSERLRQARKRDNTRAMVHAQKKLFNAMWPLEAGQKLLLDEKDPPELKAMVKKLAGELYASKARRFGRTKAAQLKPNPTLEDLQEDKVAYLLVAGWLQGGPKGAHGFCFCSDEAILALLNNPNLSPEGVRKTRQRLGLKKAPIFLAVHRDSTKVVWK